MTPVTDNVDAANPHAVQKPVIDCAGQTVGATDGSTGEIRSTQVFVAVLGALNYAYIEFAWVTRH